MSVFYFSEYKNAVDRFGKSSRAIFPAAED